MAAVIPREDMRFPDDPVAQALDETDGRYRWGRADCVTVALRAHALAGGDAPTTGDEFQALPHNDAVVQAVRRHGSVLGAYDALVGPHCKPVLMLADADILALTAPHWTVQGVGFDPADSGGAIMAFRTGAGEVWAYGPNGLAQLALPIIAARQWRLAARDA